MLKILTVSLPYTVTIYIGQRHHFSKAPRTPHTHPTNTPHGLPASFFQRQAQVFSSASKRADCLSVASFCPLAEGSTGVAEKTQP